MSKQEVLVTQEGYQELLDELENRKVVKRREIAERIKVAMAEGDLSENAEYSESKDEQNKNESRIIVLEDLLKRVKVVKPEDIKKDVVHIGGKVKVKDIEFDEEIEYTIVGATESDPFNNKISNVSPLGAALIGKKAGERVEVQSPSGTIAYEVLEVK